MNKNIEIVVGNASHGHFSKNLEKMIKPEAENGKMVKWGEADLKKAIDNKDSVLALNDKELIGFVCLFLYREYAEISALIVVSEHRRKGIAMALIERSINLAKEKYSDKNIILFANKISFQIGKQFNFVLADKESLGVELWKPCYTCPELKNFPNCHCQPMMLI